MSRFVPTSKYRSLIAVPHHPQDSYCDLNVAEVANASSAIAASSTSLAFVKGRGCDIGYLPLSATGKGQKVKTLSEHSGDILHLDFAGTHADLLLSCSQDHSAQVWRDGAHRPVASLQHTDPVAIGRWHPCASELAATVTQKVVSLWDASTESLVASTGVTNESDDMHTPPGGLIWDSVRGSWCVVSGADKYLRVVDFRRSRSAVGVEAMEPAHAGRASVKLASAASPFVIYSTGTSLARERELASWDVRKLTECLFRQRVDDGIGALVPLVDQDTGLLCLWTKGDTNVRVYEPSMSSSSSFSGGRTVHVVNRFVSCSKPCKSVVMLPKAACDVLGNEVIRLMQLTNDSIEPVRFEVPRKVKGRVLHEDLFPPTAAPLPTYTAAEWLHGDADSLEGPRKMPVLQVRELLGIGETEDEKEEDKDEEANIAQEQKAREKQEQQEEDRLKQVADAEKRLSGYFGYRAKFKYATGSTAKREHSLHNIWCELTPSDGSLIAVSDTTVALPWRGTAGPIYTASLENAGKVDHPESVSLLHGHSAAVSAICFSPLVTDKSLLASGSEDCGVRVWRVPEGGVSNDQDAAAACERSSVSLKGHQATVRLLKFHPMASGLLVSAGADHCVKLWDVTTSTCLNELGGGYDSTAEVFGDWPVSVDWSYDGGLLAVSCRDGYTRLWDPRVSVSSSSNSSSIVASFEAHLGRGKPHHVAWVGDTNLLVTSGVTRSGNRLVRVWDARVLTKNNSSNGNETGPGGSLTFGCVSEHQLDVGSSVLVPHVFEENGVVVLTGRGEPKVRVLELQGASRAVVPKSAADGSGKANEGDEEESTRGQIHSCSDYAFDSGVVTQPHSFAFFPRRVCDVKKAEWARIAVLTDSAVVPVSLTLPRAKDLTAYFGDDLFPVTRAGQAVGDTQTWLKSASNGLNISGPAPPLISMNVDGMVPLSQRDPEEAKTVTSKGRVHVSKFVQEQEAERERQREQDEAMAKIQALANQYSTVKPNLSMGVAGGATSDDEVQDDEW